MSQQEQDFGERILEQLGVTVEQVNEHIVEVLASGGKFEVVCSRKILEQENRGGWVVIEIQGDFTGDSSRGWYGRYDGEGNVVLTIDRNTLQSGQDRSHGFDSVIISTGAEDAVYMLDAAGTSQACIYAENVVRMSLLTQDEVVESLR